MSEHELPAMERFQVAWREMTESLEQVIAEGVDPVDALAGVGVELPPFAAPLLAQMFATSEGSSPLPQTA